jgi:ABC-type multidrug transport system permease subunit
LRFLIAKDLRILRRSPLLVALLVLYPIVISLLVGLALSRAPDKPRVAFADLVPRGQSSFTVGGRTIDAASYASRLFREIDPIRVHSRTEAIRKVRDGDALAALVLPPNVGERLRGALALDGGPPPSVEVYLNGGEPLKQPFVESTIRAQLAEANDALSAIVLREAARYIDIVVRGGQVSLPIVGSVDILGLERARALIDAAAVRLPHGDPARVALEQVSRFARLAAQNLDVSKPILGTIGSPVRVKQTVIAGGRTPLDAFAVAVAIAVSLMFVTLLLAAGLLALEREEHAYARLVRGLVTRSGLLAAKVVLAALCALAVSVVMLAGLALFVGLEWSRAPLWLAALALGALAFAAMGVAIGALTREVRAASLLAFALSLPLAFLALVPSGSVATGLYDVIRAISAAFPFKPALDALDAAINGGALGLPLLHLAILTAVFGVLARLGLKRFASA